MEQAIFTRRCHICGHVTEHVGAAVDRCSHCHKAFAPFCFFDERYVPVQSDGSLRPPLAKGEYLPIRGLSTYWEPF